MGSSVAQMRFLQRHRLYRSGFHIHGVFGLMGQVCASMLHLGDARVTVMRIHPILVRPLLFSLAIHPG